MNAVDCEYDKDHKSIDYVRAQSAFVKDGASHLTVTVDGRNLFDSPPGTAPAGFVDPCATRGITPP